MRNIYKYTIRTDRGQVVEVDIPCDAPILDIQLQNGEIVLWALVDTKNNLEKRKFILIMTGEPFDAVDMVFIKTVQVDAIVIHIFEDISNK